MPSYAFFQKQYVPLSEAKVGIMTHSFHYGTALFEGIRGNWNEERQQTYLFRVKEHYQRMQQGCRLLQMELPYSIDELCNITVEVARKSNFKEDIYLRPLAYKSSQALGVRLHNLDNDFLVFAIPWGPYLEVDMAKCGVSSWRRPQDNVIPPRAKITGLYINNALSKTEAIERGFDEAIMLTADGYISEGSGENIFILRDGKLVTPSEDSSILIGITRNTVIQLAQNELGLMTEERQFGLDELYTAEECFLTGTAAHITPIGEVENRTIGNGEIGEVTRKLQEIYHDVIEGNNSQYVDWCTPVYQQGS